MLNTPPEFSVEQLLQARKDGVPDYVVVPMLQKAVALRQAAQTQAQAQTPQKPPIAQQVMQAIQQPQPQGIAQLPSGLPTHHAKGGILAFAEGTPEGVPAPQEDAMAYTKDQIDPQKQMALYEKMMPSNSPVQEAGAKAIADRQASLAEDKAKAPWLSLMKAGTAMMASHSPYAMQGIGEGLSAGVDDYASRQKELGKDTTSIQDLQMQLAQAERAEQHAKITYGLTSAQANQAVAAAAHIKQTIQENSNAYHQAAVENGRGNMEAHMIQAEAAKERAGNYGEMTDKDRAMANTANASGLYKALDSLHKSPDYQDASPSKQKELDAGVYARFDNTGGRSSAPTTQQADPYGEADKFLGF